MDAPWMRLCVDLNLELRPLGLSWELRSGRHVYTYGTWTLDDEIPLGEQLLGMARVVSALAPEQQFLW